jgi:hypothetical protein
MKLYKLTDYFFETRGNTRWGEGIKHSVPTKSHPEICTSDVIHAYRYMNLGLLANQLGYDAAFVAPKLFEAEGMIVAERDNRVGVFKLTTTKQLDIPEWTKDPATVSLIVRLFNKKWFFYKLFMMSPTLNKEIFNDWDIDTYYNYSYISTQFNYKLTSEIIDAAIEYSKSTNGLLLLDRSYPSFLPSNIAEGEYLLVDVIDSVING